MSFCVKIPSPNTPEMDKFQKTMDSYWDEVGEHAKSLAKQLDITDNQALDVWYLRGRSRWSQSLEDRLIAAMKAGHSINMNEDTNEELEKIGF